MNKNFTKIVSIVMAILMILSVVSVMIYAVAGAL